MSILSLLCTSGIIYVGATLGLYMLSRVFPLAGFLGCLLAYYASLLFSSIVGTAVSFLLGLFGQGASGQWATGRCFKYCMRLSTGITVRIDDAHDYLSTTRPAVFVGNHQTELDILMLGAVFPRHCAVTAKSSLKRIPFLGWFMSLSGTVFIDRANRATAMKAFDGAAAQMRRQRQSVYIFPEGTRSYYKEPGLLPFKKGAFHLAVQAKVPIVPIVVANYSDVLHVQSRWFKSGEIVCKGMSSWCHPPWNTSPIMIL